MMLNWHNLESRKIREAQISVTKKPFSYNRAWVVRRTERKEVPNSVMKMDVSLDLAR